MSISRALISPQRLSSFWPAFWLGVALAGMKVGRIFDAGYLNRWQIADFLAEVTMVSAADLAYALAIGMLGKLALAGTRQHPRMQSLVWGTLVAFCAGSVAFGAVSMGLYDILRMPLTYPLLSMGADVANMRSSIAMFLTPTFLLTLIGLPLAYLAVTLASERLLPRRPARLLHPAEVLGMAVIAFAGLFAGARVETDWGRRYHLPKLWTNPHYALLESLLAELVTTSSASLEVDFPEAFLADFRPSDSTSTNTATQSGDVPKNVIVIVCESLSAQHLSLYGSKLNTWPRMQAEARHSLVFQNYYSHIENTSNALFSIVLSRYPMLTWREATAAYPRAAGTTVAQILRERGYRTAFISAGDNTYAKQNEFLRDRGFEVVQDFRDAHAPKAFSWGVDDRCMVDMVLKFVDESPGRPFYVLSWTQSTHHPFYTPPEIAPIDFVQGDKSLGDIPDDLNRYLNAAHELDRQLARLFDALRERGLAEKTTVVITGDHGQAFGAPHPTYFHSGNVYEEDVRVPFVVWSPGLFAKGATSDAIGAHIDLAPTVLDLLGIPAPAGWQGRSLLNPDAPRRAYFFGIRNDYIFGLRDGRYKYVLNSSQGREELYDLELDRSERMNLARAQPERCRELRQRLAAWVAYQRQHGPAADPRPKALTAR